MREVEFNWQYVDFEWLVEAVEDQTMTELEAEEIACGIIYDC